MNDVSHAAHGRQVIQLTGAQAIVRALAAEGVSHFFGIASGKLSSLLHALSQRPGMHFVGVRHEASAAMMAAAWYASTGQVAVGLGEMGPGGINLAAGAGGALNNGLASLLITTNQHRAASYPASGMFMDLDTRAVMAPLTKWTAVVNDGRRIPELVRTALREALSGRPGPVHLDVPQDQLSSLHDYDEEQFERAPHRHRFTHPPRPSQEGVRSAAELLQRAKRPLIVAGGGVVAARGEQMLRALAERLQAPVITTQMGLGVVASDSPFSIGQGGIIAGRTVRRAFEQADVVLSLGCRWSSWLWDQRGPLVRPTHQHIAVNIDPSALGHPAVHDVALLADARLAASDLLDALAPHDPSAEVRGWLKAMRAERLAYERELAESAAPKQAPMHPAALAAAIAQALPDDALAVYDGGHTSFWSNDLTPVHEVRTRFHEPGMCQLGFGLPHALALQIAQPAKPVFNITGDGSFGFTLQELDTARRHGLRVITLIHNNESWGVIRQGQKALSFELGTSLEGTDYAAIARGFGCHGETVLSPEDVAPAIERARASGLPAVIDCRTRFVPHPCMPDFGSMNRFGFQP